MEPEIFECNELQYAETGAGPWKLYVYGRDGFHAGSVWFRRGPMKYPDEEITAEHAKLRTDNAVAQKREVRICDGGDMLVFHSQNGKVVYGDKFWEEVDVTTIHRERENEGNETRKEDRES